MDEQESEQLLVKYRKYDSENLFIFLTLMHRTTEHLFGDSYYPDMWAISSILFLERKEKYSDTQYRLW